MLSKTCLILRSAHIGSFTGSVAGKVCQRSSGVQTHSEDSPGDGGPMFASKILSHRRRPVPMAGLDPGLRREDNEEASH